MIEGRDVIAIPMSYFDEFKRDPLDSLLKFGSMPQRARAPWFTNVQTIIDSMILPDRIIGPRAEIQRARQLEYRALVAATDPTALLDGIDPLLHATDPGYWHVHVDLALNKKRHGDAAGLALGRIRGHYIEKARDSLGNSFERVVNSYEVPLAAQIIAPVGDQIYFGAIVRFILALKQVRGFNITSFSTDQFQSADIGQQLMLAGLVTAGMRVDRDTGIITGLPKPFSVDGRNTQPYRELLEACNEGRCLLPDYALLGRELRELEIPDPGFAPDHPITGSKDVADCCAGVVGYLGAYGHAELVAPGEQVMDRDDLDRVYAFDATQDFTIEDDEDWTLSDEPVSFVIE